MSVRHFPILAITALILSALACNIPSNASTPSSPSNPSNPPTGQTEVAPAQTEAPAASSGSGACANPYYPVVVGATWTYSMTGVTTSEFTRSITAVNADGFTDSDAFSQGITRSGEWKCDNGVLIALQPDSGASGTVQAQNVQASFQTTSMDGVTLPAALKAGDTWSQNFVLEGTESINGLEIPAKSETNFSCTAGNTESVTVAAGTFDAIRSECTTEIKITITMNNTAVPTNVSTTSTMWYVQGVGMIKTESVISGAGNSVIELKSYSIP